MYITKHWKNIITKFDCKNNLGKTDGFFSGISNIYKKKYMVQCTNFVYKKKKNSAQYLADNLTTNSKNLTDYKKYPYEIVYTLKKIIIKKIATTPF